MAIWQFRLVLVPETALLEKYSSIPAKIPLEVAEDRWWSGAVQPQRGFEQQINSILPSMESWSKSMRMWGYKDSDDAYVIYVDDDLSEVEEIAFRLDARCVSPELIRQICLLASRLASVFVTADGEIVPADEERVLTALDRSPAKTFVDDPIATLTGRDWPTIWLPGFTGKGEK